MKGVIMTLIKHEIKANLKTLLIWGLTVGGMNFLMMLIFPSVKEQMAGMVEMYANMGSFSQAFGMDKINFTTPLGFYGIEAGAVLSLGGSMFAAILGTGMLAKEEGAHTAEFLFTTPHTRTYHVALKAVALGLLVLLFNLLAIGFGYGSFLAINVYDWATAVRLVLSRLQPFPSMAQLICHSRQEGGTALMMPPP